MNKCIFTSVSPSFWIPNKCPTPWTWYRNGKTTQFYSLIRIRIHNRMDLKSKKSVSITFSIGRNHDFDQGFRTWFSPPLFLQSFKNGLGFQKIPLSSPFLFRSIRELVVGGIFNQVCVQERGESESGGDTEGEGEEFTCFPTIYCAAGSRINTLNMSKEILSLKECCQWKLVERWWVGGSVKFCEKFKL